MTSHSKGITFITVSAVFYASYGIWSKVMMGIFGEFTQAWTRGIAILIIILVANLRFHFLKSITRKDLPWFIAIGLCGGLNQAPYYFGFVHLNIGTALVLFYASLVASGYIIGNLFFKEVLGGIKLTSLGLAMIGMVSIYQFSLSQSQIFPAIGMILAGFMGGTACVLTKKLSGNYSELQIILCYSFFTFLANGIFAILFHEPIPSFIHLTAWMGQLGYLIAYLIANIAVIEGFRHLEPSVGSIVGLTEILFGFLFGIIFFNESLTVGVVVGGLLILTSAALPNFPFGKSRTRSLV
jgi:drug/metabolite transporter (DMT)-like permease